MGWTHDWHSDDTICIQYFDRESSYMDTINMNLGTAVVMMELNGTGTILCPMIHFGIGVEFWAVLPQQR
jgi:hypothetical protein